MSPDSFGGMLPTPATALTAPSPAREVFGTTSPPAVAEDFEGIRNVDLPTTLKNKTIYHAHY